jgi:aryl-alcohol dehydrogenase
MRIDAAVVNAAREAFSVEALELEEPRDDEVFVRVMAAGMCRVDLLARDQDIPVALPAVLGSEGAGRVERVGAKVMSVAPGDRVIFARDGASPDLFGRRISRFRSVEFAALHRSGQPIAGSAFGHSCFATHVLTEERNLVKVPADDTPFPVLAALGGDVQAGASAVIDTLRPRPGSSIAIFGAGAAGLSAVLAAGLVGCHPIVAVDIKASRLDMAEQFGADHTIDPDGLDPIAVICDVAAGGVGFAIDTTGDPSVVGQALECVAPGGSCVLAGAGSLETDVSVKFRLLLQRRTLVGSPSGASNPAEFLPRLVALYRQGRFPIDRLITEFRFEDINEAADALLSGAAVKPVLMMP